jgi:hypothetical protein
LFLYSYFRKVSTPGEEAKDMKKKLVEAEEENANLKGAMAKQEEELRVLG